MQRYEIKIQYNMLIFRELQEFYDVINQHFKM